MTIVALVVSFFQTSVKLSEIDDVDGKTGINLAEFAGIFLFMQQSCRLIEEGFWMAGIDKGGKSGSTFCAWKSEML